MSSVDTKCDFLFLLTSGQIKGKLSRDQTVLPRLTRSLSLSHYATQRAWAEHDGRRQRRGRGHDKAARSSCSAAQDRATGSGVSSAARLTANGRYWQCACGSVHLVVGLCVCTCVCQWQSSRLEDWTTWFISLFSFVQLASYICSVKKEKRIFIPSYH